jgi:hypothetical protein
MNDCIEWHLYRNKDGYGTVSYRGKRGVRAHRLAYVRAKGIDIDDIEGMVVRHKCDNPGCVNPDHLEIGTQKDNMQDAIARGRKAMFRGSELGSSKLTESDIPAIRRLMASGVRQERIGEMFGVSQNVISQIKRGRIWRHA